ncbi:WD repeat-containing protein WRAP73-like isoform X1 [Acanthaster planci]|uniref:WD repeat-containing protein WRAP73-like isoform X1 n=2 Tax=Acanthaster planci TaxID=133434 RepID=A0A8B7Z4R9_ACAPL|nr:WD repeat-containing protein WRAP73-like isoform X1 [Acanthaster planci]
MNFSEPFKQSSHLCKFSPNGKYLANILQYRLIVRDVQSLQILQLYTCLDTVQHMEWSSDSAFILCGMFKRGIIQVWSLEQPEWTCKIDEGSAGLIAVRWSPDGRHILTTAEFHLRITVWSLVTKSVSYIKYPKEAKQPMHFSHDGKYLALAERRDCKDFISVFACNTWQLVKHFETDTRDMAGLEWSPDGRVLCVWDSLLEYKVLLYSVDGRCLATFKAYDYALGIKSIAWSPSSQFLAIGSFDQKVRVLNHITWKTVVEHTHPPNLDSGSVVLYKEVEKRPQLVREGGRGGSNQTSWRPDTAMFSVQSKYEVLTEGSIQIPVVKPDPDKANPKVGISQLSFSPDNRYMASKNDNMPNALWIWDVQKLCQSVLLLQVNTIRCMQWDPIKARLAVCTSSNKLYMWSPAGCVAVEVPAEASFQVNWLQWHPDGNAILLMSKDQMCVCFLTEDSA